MMMCLSANGIYCKATMIALCADSKTTTLAAVREASSPRDANIHDTELDDAKLNSVGKLPAADTAGLEPRRKQPNQYTKLHSASKLASQARTCAHHMYMCTPYGPCSRPRPPKNVQLIIVDDIASFYDVQSIAEPIQKVDGLASSQQQPQQHKRLRQPNQYTYKRPAQPDRPRQPNQYTYKQPKQGKQPNQYTYRPKQPNQHTIKAKAGDYKLTPPTQPTPVAMPAASTIPTFLGVSRCGDKWTLRLKRNGCAIPPMPIPATC